MTKKIKKEKVIIILGVILFVLFIKFDAVVFLFRKIIDLCFPLILGLLFALILNAPMRGFEKIIDKCFFRKKLSGKGKCRISLLLSIISILLALILVITMAIPKISDSFESLIGIIEPRIPKLLILLEKYGFDTTGITDKLEIFNAE